MKASAPPLRRRMSAFDRRRQLLDVASDLVRKHGAADLTLARVAEAAGVTKPVAYDHFGTREDLMRSLYAELGAQHEAAVAEALRAGEAGRLGRAAIARVISVAFVDCVLDNGPVYTALRAALSAAAGGHADVHRASTRRYALALAAFYDVAPQEAYGETVAFLGAGEALAEAVMRGDIARQAGIDILAQLLLAARPAA